MTSHTNDPLRVVTTGCGPDPDGEAIARGYQEAIARRLPQGPLPPLGTVPAPDGRLPGETHAQVQERTREFRALCSLHPHVDYRVAWGCPDCVVALRKERQELQGALERVVRERDDELCRTREHGEFIARMFEEAPCPKCGAGLSAQCIGCLLKAVQGERDALRDELGEVKEAMRDGLDILRGERDAAKAHMNSLLKDWNAIIEQRDEARALLRTGADCAALALDAARRHQDTIGDMLAPLATWEREAREAVK